MMVPRQRFHNVKVGLRRSGLSPLRLTLLAVAVSSSFLVLLYASVSAETLRILHTNDMHARHLPFRVSSGDTLGGFARLATLIQRERAAAPGPSLLVDAGDVSQGTPFYAFYRGEAEFTVMSAMGYEAMALGNHELDNGAANVIEMATKHAEFHVLSANVLVPPAMLEPWRDHIILPGSPGSPERIPVPIAQAIARGTRETFLDVDMTFLRKGATSLALIGVTTETLPMVLTAKGLEGLVIKPVVESLQRAVPRAREHADLVILLSHCGLDADSVTAATVPGIDVIISGHDHRAIDRPRFVGNPANDNGIGGTLMFETGSWGGKLGCLDLQIEGRKITAYDGRLIPVTSDIPEDSTVAAIIDRYRAGIELLVSEVIAESPIAMPDDSLLETGGPLGNLVADYMRRFAGADIALQNGGGIRAPLPEGAIRIGDLYSLLPFDNSIVTMTMTGGQVEALCREMIGMRGAGGFGHISGITFDAGPGGPSNIRVKGMPLDPDSLYVLATNSFTAGGGDGYTFFGSVTNRRDTGVILRDAVIDLMRKDRRITPSTELRIRFIEG